MSAVAPVSIDGQYATAGIHGDLVKVGQVTRVRRAGGTSRPNCANDALLYGVLDARKKGIIISLRDRPTRTAVISSGDIRIPSAREIWSGSSVIGAQRVAGIGRGRSKEEYGRPVIVAGHGF